MSPTSWPTLSRIGSGGGRHATSNHMPINYSIRRLLESESRLQFALLEELFFVLLLNRDPAAITVPVRAKYILAK